MRVIRPLLLSATLLGLSLLLSGCNDTTNQVTNPAPETTGFAADSGKMSKSPWQVPTFGYSMHREDAADSWAISASALNDARPGGIDTLLIGDGSISTMANGGFAYEPTVLTGSQGPSVNAVQQDVVNFFGGKIDGNRRLARSADNSIYELLDGASAWRLYLPETITVGTTWQSSLSDNDMTVGQVFVTQSVGQIAYEPRIRTIEGALPVGDDPNTTKNIVAVDIDGLETNDESQAAIDYKFTEGFVGEFKSVKRHGKLTVTKLGVSTPDGKFSDCIQVSLNYSFDVDGYYKPESQIHGLEYFSANYTLYWKKNVGWVYWTGSEKTPRWGYSSLPLRNSPYLISNGNLSYFNQNFDFNFYGEYIYYAYGIYTNYQNSWMRGLNQAYQDQDSGISDFDRRNLADALEIDRVIYGTTDANLINDYDGSAHGQRLACDAGFTAGYNLGEEYYRQDFVAIAHGSDSFVGIVHRGNLSLGFNLIPEQFRASQILYVNNLNRYDVLDIDYLGYSGYMNGSDGYGTVVRPLNANIRKNINNLEQQKCPNGQPLPNVYITFPTAGVIISKSYTGSSVIPTAALPGNG